MNSPPASPPQFDLCDASRVTGGTLHGRAYGNVYNHADAKDVCNLESQMGKIHVYTTHVDPNLTKPDMVFKQKVTSKLKSLLKTIARGYSPVRSKLSTFFWIILPFVCR